MNSFSKHPVSSAMSAKLDFRIAVLNTVTMLVVAASCKLQILSAVFWKIFQVLLQTWRGVTGLNWLEVWSGDLLWDEAVKLWVPKKKKKGGRHAAGCAVVWSTAVQAWRSRVRFPMVSLEFFIDVILPVALWPWSTQNLTEMSTRNTCWGVKAAGA